jgi:uncharacterized protein (TIGR03435 family)
MTTVHSLLSAFLNHPEVQALARALLHFIWQGALLAGAFLVATALTRAYSARLRYAIGCTVMSLMPIVFVATILRSESSPQAAFPSQRVTTPGSIVIPLDSAGVDRAFPASSAIVPGSDADWLTVLHLAALPGWTVFLWLAGVLALSMYTVVGWLRVQLLRQRSVEPANAAWTETMDNIARRLEISKPVRLYISAIAEVPTVIGWIRPFILLPFSAVTGLSQAQLRAILAHELAHVRRYDYLVNLLQNAIETLLFYHPAVWWVSRQIRQEREHCCDDIAVEVCGDVMVYAGALTQLEELRGTIPEPALAATGGELLARVRRLMGQRGEKAQDRIPASVGATMAVALVVAAVMGAGNAPAIHAQSPVLPESDWSASETLIPAATPIAPPVPSAPKMVAQAAVPRIGPPAAQPAPQARPKFDVASIRPCDANSPRAGRGRGGVSASFHRDCVTVMELIRDSYIRFTDGQNRPPLLSILTKIEGGPGWIDSDEYTINAEAAEAVSLAVMFGPMVQTLLEDRFRLKIHRETREGTAYALTMAKGGSKLQPARQGPCVAADFEGSPFPAPPFPSEDTRQCFMMWTAPKGPNRTEMARNVGMEELTTALTAVTGRIVIDKTGFTGKFDYRLVFSGEDLPPFRSAPTNTDDPPQAGDPAGPSIFTALEQELGLKLEPTRAPREYLVIDHIERPSEN